MSSKVEAQLLSARKLVARGEVGAAQKVCAAILEKFPGNLRARQLMADIGRKVGGRNEMEAMAAVTRLAEMLQHMKFDLVVADATAAIEKFPEVADLYSLLGAAESGRGNYPAAIAAHKSAQAIDPRNGRRYYNLAVAQMAAGDHDAAIAGFSRAKELDPRHVEAWVALGKLHAIADDYDKAVEVLSQAIKVMPGMVQAQISLADALRMEDRIDEAKDMISKALQSLPNSASAHFTNGKILVSAGDKAGALEALRKAIEIDPTSAEALRMIAPLVPKEEVPGLLDQIRKSQEGRNPKEPDYVQLGLARFQSALRVDDLPQAFEWLNKANAAKKEQSGYSLDKDQAMLNRLRENFRTPIAPLKVEPAQPAPIFVLGMPRSGTTLTEQILNSHSQVVGRGELRWMNQACRGQGLPEKPVTQAMLRKIREHYLRFAQPAPEAGVRFFTDKMPGNFWWIGVILLALPEARILRINRDARAVCWSNLRNLFSGVALSYSYDQIDVARYFGFYTEIMDFWHKTFPGRIHDVDYEAMTEEPETVVRGMLDFVGLPWEDQVLNFHESSRPIRTVSALQVRQKIYKGSSEEWRKYENYLQPMLKELDRLGIT